MRPAYDVDAVRAAEAPLLASLPPGALMQRAAAGLARRCAGLLGAVYGARVVLLVGGGNNGADAMYAGARLARRGARVDALLLTADADEGALRTLQGCGGRCVLAGGDADTDLMGAADLVVDGMVGIGGTGGLREPQARLARLSADAGVLVVAVDVPSGVDASTGEVSGVAMRADVTVTFGALKPGLLVDPGAAHAGQVELVDIGLRLPDARVEALDAADVAALLPQPGPESDKYRRGVVGVVAGSERYPGAAVLAVGGALAAGAGMVRYVGPPRPAALVNARWPEAVVTVTDAADPAALDHVGRVQAWVCGPGLGVDDNATQLVRSVCDRPEPVLLDADALGVLAEHPRVASSRSATTVVTPHAGEFARLLRTERGQVEARRLTSVRDAAAELGAVVLLKGSTTLVASSGGDRVRVNTTGTPQLATAGSGDVLSGLAGGLLAGGLGGFDAASVAAFLHGLAGLLVAGEPATPITATDVIAAVPQAVRTVRG